MEHPIHQTTYATIHYQITLPVLVLVFLLAKPIIHPRLDKIKLSTLAILSFIYTTPWDNWIIAHGAWAYCHTCTLNWTLGGYVPIEEYAFFLIQTLTTGFLALLITNLGPSPIEILQASITVRCRSNYYRVLAALVCLWTTAVSNLAFNLTSDSTFYMSAIIAWAAPVLVLQWSIAGHYILACWKRGCFAVSVSSLYLWAVDWYAIQAGTWTISPQYTLGVWVLFPLPIEEATFFVITNLMLVGGILAFDRTFALMYLHDKLLPSYDLPVPSQFWQWYSCTILHDQLLIPDILVKLNDMATNASTIRKGSKSFYYASGLLPWDLRTDIHALYGFCRITDDIADSVHIPQHQRKSIITRIRIWLETTYASNPNSGRLHELRLTDYKHHKHAEIAFRSVLRIIQKYKISESPMMELMRGYKWDVDGHSVTSEHDLILYSSYVAGTVGQMSAHMMIRWSQWTVHDQLGVEKSGSYGSLIDRARDLGIGLQLINIARDLVTDSRLGRMYVPREFLNQCCSSDQLGLPQDDPSLHKIAALLIKTSEPYFHRALLHHIPDLPRCCCLSIITAANVYRAIGHGLLDSASAGKPYPERFVVSKSRKLLEVTKCLYR